MANGTVIKGNGDLPEIWILNYHRSGGAPKAPKGQGEVRQGKRTGGKGKDLILVNLLTRTCIVLQSFD